METDVRRRETIVSLMEDVAAGIRVLATRDGIAVSERQVWERARNIVAGLMGNYRIVSFGDQDEDDEVAHEGVDEAAHEGVHEGVDEAAHARFSASAAKADERVSGAVGHGWWQG